MARAIIDAIRIGPEKNFSYLILCRETGVAGLVDASFEFDRVIAWAQSFQSKLTGGGALKVKYLLATHGHWDHAGGFPEMQNRIKDAKIIAHESETARLAKSKMKNDIPLKDNEVFRIGNVEVKALHTPGHTEGGCCYLVEDQLFSGDTLFIGQCGRTDLPGGDDRLLFSSLQRLKTLPPQTIVRPGHDYGPTPQSTIEHEIRTNPTLQAKNLEEFKSLP
jgi:hydroxyacylglutathione hydrolase